MARHEMRPELARKALELQSMQHALEYLAHHCHDDQRPDCPILDDLQHGEAH